MNNQVVISPSNAEVPTCSDYEVDRLELYNDYNGGFDFRLKNHQIPMINILLEKE